MEQSAEQSPEQPWWQFRRGVSGNPRGRASRGDRIKAEAERLTGEFTRLHGRPPTAFEVAAVRGAAVLCERLAKPPLDVEGVVKLQNALARALRRLGMGDIANRNAPPRLLAHDATTFADRVAAVRAQVPAAVKESE
jgi:hypothetical protein